MPAPIAADPPEEVCLYAGFYSDCPYYNTNGYIEIECDEIDSAYYYFNVYSNESYIEVWGPWVHDAEFDFVSLQIWWWSSSGYWSIYLYEYDLYGYQIDSYLEIWVSQSSAMSIDDFAPATFYTVTFLDWNNSVISKQAVESGSNAIAPNGFTGTRPDWDFIGWSSDFTNIQSNLNVSAIYSTTSFYMLYCDLWDDDDMPRYFLDIDYEWFQYNHDLYYSRRTITAIEITILDRNGEYDSDPPVRMEIWLDNANEAITGDNFVSFETDYFPAPMSMGFFDGNHEWQSQNGLYQAEFKVHYYEISM